MREVTGTKVRPAHVRSGNQVISPGLAELLALGVDPQAGGEELGLQRVGPAPVGSGSCGGSAAKRATKRSSGGIGARSLRHFEQQRHRAVVDELDVHVRAEHAAAARPRRSQKRSYSGSACSGRAAAT